MSCESRLLISLSPNGMMEIWTERPASRAKRGGTEKATILGRRVRSFEHRHSLDGFKQQRRSTNAGAWLAVLGGLSPAPTPTGLQLSIVASSFKYNRDQEQAAGLLGFKYLAAAGYPTSAAADVWKHVMAEQDATAIGHRRKPGPEYQDGFFNTPPVRDAESISRQSQKKIRGYRQGRWGGAVCGRLSRLICQNGSTPRSSSMTLAGPNTSLQQLAGDGWSGDLLAARAANSIDFAATRGICLPASNSTKGAIAAGYSQPQALSGTWVWHCSIRQARRRQICFGRVSSPLTRRQ